MPSFPIGFPDPTPTTGAQSQRANVGSSAQSQRANVHGAQSQRANINSYPQSMRANVIAPQSQRANVASRAVSIRQNVARPQSCRANVGSSAQSQRANVYNALPTGFDDSGATAPPAYGGGVLGYGAGPGGTTDGEMTFSCDFEVTVTWRKDGFYSTYIISLGTKLGCAVYLTLTDYGGCIVGFTPASATAAGEGLGGFHCPAPYLDPIFTGPPMFYTSADQYIFYGVKESPAGSGNLVSCDPNTNPCLVGVYNGGTGVAGVTYVPINDGDTFTMSGHFEFGIHVSEYKTFGWNDGGNGTGEVMGDLEYQAIANPGYRWRYSSSITSHWGKDPRTSNFPDQLSGAYGVGQRNHYADGTLPRGTPTSITFDSGSEITCEATGAFSTDGGALQSVYSGSLTASTVKRKVTATFTNIQFNSGIWHPQPYDGDFVGTGTTPIGHLTIRDGYLKSDGTPFSCNAASAATAKITGNFYFGDALATADQDLVFGSVDIVSGLVSRDTADFPQYLTARNGNLNVDVPRIRSSCGMDRGSGGTGAHYWSPDLPLDRDDFVFKGINLLPGSNGDYLVWLLDDVSWNATTFTHDSSVTLDNFSSLAGWSAINGTVGSPNLTMVGTASGYKASRATGYNKDCRNYRYLHLDVTSSADGDPLTLNINNGAKIFQTKPLVNGSQTLEVDLCRPQSMSGPSMTRTGWDKVPDAIYGVQNIDRLDITGVANGQTVKISSLTLIRKATHCPGSCWPEATRIPVTQTPEVEWFPPDVPTPSLTCPYGTEDEDQAFATLTSSSRLYARLLRNRVDGKIGADLPHAIGHPPFSDPYDFLRRPLGFVRYSDRLMFNEFVTMVNAQTGLHCTTAADGPNGYLASHMFACFLTVDNYITAADPNLDTNGTALKARPFYSGVRTYPGQLLHCQYAFLKRLGTIIDGLVVNPAGTSKGNFHVSLASCRTPTTTPAQDTTTDADGYYRFAAVPPGELFSVKTASVTGYALGRPRGFRWIGLGGSSASPFNPWNYQDQWGRYHRVLIQDGNVMYWRSDFAVPLPWKLDSVKVTKDGTDSYPRLVMDDRGILIMVFTRTVSGSPSIYRMVSWDDGATWGDGTTKGAATVAIASGVKGTNVIGVDGMYIEAAVVLGSPNVIKARKQGIGDPALSSLYTFVDHDSNPLQVEDDTFHIQQGQHGSARWLLHVHIAGEDTTSDWYSTDFDASTWTRIT